MILVYCKRASIKDLALNSNTFPKADAFMFVIPESLFFFHIAKTLSLRKWITEILELFVHYTTLPHRILGKLFWDI